jgi:hypothetical protein
MSAWKSTEKQPTGYQRHHLIAVNVMRSRAFAKLFTAIANAGFNPHCFLNNGFSLPSTEESAKTGLPLHRGPHRQYDEFIAECLNKIWLAVLIGHVPENPVLIMTYISDLQGEIRRSLGPDDWIRLNQHDPRNVQSQLFLTDDSIKHLDWVQILASLIAG